MTSQIRPVPLPVDVLAVGSINSSHVRAAKNVRPVWRLPGAVLGWLRRQGSLVRFGVLLPVLLGGFYFGLITSDINMSESEFVAGSGGKSDKSESGMLLNLAGFANARDEVRSAQGFIQSRGALRSLKRDGLARKAWGNNDVYIANRFDPLGMSGLFQEFYLYYVGEAGAKFDTKTGITTQTVRHYSAQNTQVIVNASRIPGHFRHGTVGKGRELAMVA
jgi:capsular polysaccharide transport system permease protein